MKINFRAVSSTRQNPGDQRLQMTIFIPCISLPNVDENGKEIWNKTLPSRQWSLIPDKNLREPSYKIPNSSSCFGIFVRVKLQSYKDK